MDSIDEIKTELRVLSDRMSDLENQVLRQPRSKPARNWMLGLMVATVALALSPKDIRLGGFAYQSEGVPLETITALAGIFAAGKWGLERYQENNND